MPDRILPTPEKFASCPGDGKILDFYANQFESVYILLHPFLKPISIEFDRFRPETWPSKKDIIEGCKGVSWHEILTLTNLESLSDIDVGLRTSIGGLKKKYSNQEWQ